jgi:hypothetical protein
MTGIRYFLRFRVSFYFNLLSAFLASSSLGPGSGKRTQKPLGAHQRENFDRNEREHGCLRFTTQLRFLYWKFDIIRSLYINASFHHLGRFTLIIH